MKKNRNRPQRARLQTLDTAQLEKVSGGLSGITLYGIGGEWEEGSGWREFFYAAGAAALS